jgi:putative peptidoglycan lipid II flippase
MTSGIFDDPENSGGAPRFAFASLRGFQRVALIFALSRSLGLLREIGIAAYFGTSGSADRISTAFVISSFATTAVSEVVGAAAIVQLSRDRMTSASIYAQAKRWIPAATAGYIVLSLPLAALITRGDGGGSWDGPLFTLAMAPCVATAMLAALGGAVLTLEGRIGRVTASQACWSAGALAGIAVVIAGWHSPLPVALGWSAGNVVGFLVIKRSVDIRGPKISMSASELVRPYLAVAFAYSLLSIQSITDRLVASRLQRGAIAALGYADRLHLFPVGFILAAYGPAVLGDLMNRKHDPEAAALHSTRHMQRLVQVATPATFAAVAFAPFILRFLLGHGEFNGAATTLTLGALDGLLCGIVATCLTLTLLRVTQALGSLKRLPLITSISVLSNLIISVGLSFVLGLAGIALGTSLVAILTAILQAKLLEAELGRAWFTEVARSCLLPAAISLAVGALVTVLAYEGVIGDAGRFLICAGGAAAAAMTARLLVRA